MTLTCICWWGSSSGVFIKFEHTHTLPFILAHRLNVLVWFYGISTLVSYLLPNLVCTDILNKYDLVGLDFYGISTFAGHLIPNPLYTYILNI